MQSKRAVMRIMVLCMSSGQGGLELYVLRELQKMSVRGHKCMAVVCPKSMLASRLHVDDIPYIALKPIITALPILKAKRLARILDEQAFDVLHIHWAHDLALAVLARRSAKRKVALVYSRHMGITRSKKDIYHRFLYTQVNKVLAISRQVQKQANECLPVAEEDIELLYHGVPEGQPIDTGCCEVLFKNSRSERRKFNLVLFGRIEWGKGQHVLVDAIDIMVKGGDDIGVLIVGHVMDQSYYNKLVLSVQDRGLQDYISFLDFMENPQILMPCFDAVVLTTYCETFGLVLIEAMRAGVTVIGTDAGGVPEIIEHEKSGLLFEPGDEKDLASCILKLSRDIPFREKLAKAGKARADEMFAEDKHFSKLEEILLAVCH